MEKCSIHFVRYVVWFRNITVVIVIFWVLFVCLFVCVFVFFIHEFGVGGTIIPLNLDFLFRNCNSDFLILKQFKDVIPERNSTLNNALVLCNGIMHCGTTVDQFLRDNLEWMGKAAHWAKFAATSSLGMIHHHHLDQSMNILQRYLPGTCVQCKDVTKNQKYINVTCVLYVCLFFFVFKILQGVVVDHIKKVEHYTLLV